MLILADALLALLAAVGLASLAWLVFGAHFRPPRAEEALALVIARGEAENLEQTVRALSRQKLLSRILILDGGLDAEAKARAELLCRELGNTELVE